MVELTRVVRGYDLGIEDVFKEYYADKSTYRILTQEIKDDEDFTPNVVEAGDILACWTGFIPGFLELDTYGDFHVQFDMFEVRKANWDIKRLVGVLQSMADAINSNEPIEAFEAPWKYQSKDAYGNDIWYTRFPAVLPLEGMLEVEYPQEIQSHGGARGFGRF